MVCNRKVGVSMSKSMRISGSIYKGENRILVVPLIKHISGLYVHSENVQVINDYEDYFNIGNALLSAKKIIEDSPVSEELPKEREAHAVWKLHSKYKSRQSFWKNNYHAIFEFMENGECDIFSTMKIKGGNSGCIKKIILPPESTPEELGKAVAEVFEAAEEYYKENRI